MAAEGSLVASNLETFIWVAGIGLAGVAFGLVYHAVRAILARRHLPATRYRGPSVMVLLAFAFLIANVAAIPFAEEAFALVTGEGSIETGAAAVILTSTQLALVAMVGLFVAWPRALAGAPPFDGGSGLASVRRGLGYGAVAWVVASLLQVGIGSGLERVGIDPQPQAAEQAIALIEPWLIVVAIVIVAPIAEEIFFRGVVYNAWRREHGRTRALIGSSVLFALIHVSLVALVPIFLLGLGLAWLYERTSSLLACVVMHATVNGISVTLALLVRFEVIRLPA